METKSNFYVYVLIDPKQPEQIAKVGYGKHFFVMFQAKGTYPDFYDPPFHYYILKQNLTRKEAKEAVALTNSLLSLVKSLPDPIAMKTWLSQLDISQEYVPEELIHIPLFLEHIIYLVEQNEMENAFIHLHCEQKIRTLKLFASKYQWKIKRIDITYGENNSKAIYLISGKNLQQYIPKLANYFNEKYLISPINQQAIYDYFNQLSKQTFQAVISCQEIVVPPPVNIMGAWARDTVINSHLRKMERGEIFSYEK